jgi:predicted RNA-binding Zn-ribbon protein involved in translation (DUF1610 family)
MKLLFERKYDMSVMDDYYASLKDKPEPIKFMCNCGWQGNKPRKIKFKKTLPKECCPDCGERTFWRAEHTFWMTANGLI